MGFILAQRRGVSRPIRLLKRAKWKLLKWIDKFAAHYGFGTAVFSYTVSHFYYVRLCPKHSAVEKTIMLEIESSAIRCSIRSTTTASRPTGDLTKFDLDRFSNASDARCLVEDALALRTDNRVQLKDLKYLCSPCRLVVCNRVYMRQSLPSRDQSSLVVSISITVQPLRLFRCASCTSALC